jgi:hypothetical protein
MKLRWIDSKSKRLQEVFIDLNAILSGSAGTQRASSPLSAMLPMPALLAREEEPSSSSWRTALDTRPHLD